MNSKDNKILYGVIGAILFIVIIALGTYVYLDRQDTQTADTTNTPDTNTDVPDTTAEEQNQTSNEPVSMTSFQSEKGVAITLESPERGATVISPLNVKGTVPGSWSNEGQFTLRLLDSNSTVLANGTATLDGDWMTTSPVPFSATLTFDAPDAGSVGLLVLEKANPSGMEEGADSLTVPIQF